MENHNTAASQTGVFLCGDWARFSSGESVRTKFIRYMTGNGYSLENSYFCAKKDSTPSTAINWENVCPDSSGNPPYEHYYLGVYYEETKSWTVHDLNWEKILDGFKRKQDKNMDYTRLNIDEKLGEKIDV